MINRASFAMWGNGVKASLHDSMTDAELVALELAGNNGRALKRYTLANASTLAALSLSTERSVYLKFADLGQASYQYMCVDDVRYPEQGSSVLPKHDAESCRNACLGSADCSTAVFHGDGRCVHGVSPALASRPSATDAPPSRGHHDNTLSTMPFAAEAGYTGITGRANLAWRRPVTTSISDAGVNERHNTATTDAGTFENTFEHQRKHLQIVS